MYTIMIISLYYIYLILIQYYVLPTNLFFEILFKRINIHHYVTIIEYVLLF